MNQYNEISTLQYIESKASIISHICEPIIKNKHIETVVDLFAGTGFVAIQSFSCTSIIAQIWYKCSISKGLRAISIVSSRY